MSQQCGPGRLVSLHLAIKLLRDLLSKIGLSYLLPHFDEEELSRKIEENIGVVGIVPNVRDGNVK